jgi:hypothetical protein
MEFAAPLARPLRLPLFSLGWGQVALDSWAINRAAALCILLHAGDSDGSLGDNGLAPPSAVVECSPSVHPLYGPVGLNQAGPGSFRQFFSQLKIK